MGERNTYLVTGGTGLIGKHLVGRLLERGGHVFVLIRPGSMARHENIIKLWRDRARLVGADLHIVAGDVTEAGLGVSEEAVLDTAFDHVFDVKGYYDIAGDDARMRLVNVDGTRNLVDTLSEKGFSGVLHHVSSVAVAGDFEGEFPEAELDLGQSMPHPYHQSKYDGEAVVRAADLRTRIYRPSAVVGHSVTGEMDRVDGPYFLFKPAQKLRYALPGWFPLAGWTSETLNIVPVDFVAAAIDHIAHQPDRDGETFHVVDPEPQSFQQVFNAVAEAAGSPKIAKTFGGGKGASMLGGVRQTMANMGMTKFIKNQLLDQFQIPREVSAAKNAKVTYDTTNLLSALEGSGIVCPKPTTYMHTLWHYWAQNLDPDRDEVQRFERAFDGRRVLITGASSGVGEALSLACAEHGAHVLCVARREEELQRVVARIREAGGAADYYVADLGKSDDADKLIADVVADHGHIDMLVNNAAKSIRRSIAESIDRIHDYERVMEINYFAPVRLTLGFLPGMRERGYGHVVNVLTAGAHMPTPRFSAYAASKSALGSFSDSFSAEFIHENIFTTSAYLSWVATPMMTATEKYQKKVEQEEIMTPEAAAAWIMNGVVDRKRHLKSATTTRRFVWNQIFPGFMTRSLSIVFQLYHDDVESFPEFEVDRAVFKRFFKTDLV